MRLTTISEILGCSRRGAELAEAISLDCDCGVRNSDMTIGARTEFDVGFCMPFIHRAGRLVYRLRRRIAITLLATMLTGIVGSVCFVVWVVRTTMPVVVVDENGRPVSGAIIFDWSRAMEARSRHR